MHRVLTFLSLLVAFISPTVAAPEDNDQFLFEGEKLGLTFIGPIPSRVPYGIKAIMAKLGATFEKAGAKLAPPPGNNQGAIVYPEPRTSRPVSPQRSIERREPTADVVIEVAIDLPAATLQSLNIRDGRGRTIASGRRQNVLVAFTLNFWRITADGRATVKMTSLDAPFSEEVQLRVVTSQLNLERDEATPIFYQHAFDAGLKDLEAKLRPMFERRLVVIGSVVHCERLNPKDPSFVVQLRRGVVGLLDGAIIEVWEPAAGGGAPLQPKLRLTVRKPQHSENEPRMVLCEVAKEDTSLLEKIKPGDAVVTTAIPGVKLVK